MKKENDNVHSKFLEIFRHFLELLSPFSLLITTFLSLLIMQDHEAATQFLHYWTQASILNHVRCIDVGWLVDDFSRCTRCQNPNTTSEASHAYRHAMTLAMASLNHRRNTGAAGDVLSAEAAASLARRYAVECPFNVDRQQLQLLPPSQTLLQQLQDAFSNRTIVDHATASSSLCRGAIAPTVPLGHQVCHSDPRPTTMIAAVDMTIDIALEHIASYASQRHWDCADSDDATMVVCNVWARQRHCHNTYNNNNNSSSANHQNRPYHTHLQESLCVQSLVHHRLIDIAQSLYSSDSRTRSVYW
jgi:hypothetical protein